MLMALNPIRVTPSILLLANILQNVIVIVVLIILLYFGEKFVTCRFYVKFIGNAYNLRSWG
jgi:hypothetical protein